MATSKLPETSGQRRATESPRAATATGGRRREGPRVGRDTLDSSSGITSRASMSSLARGSRLLKSSCSSGARYGTPAELRSTASDHGTRAARVAPVDPVGVVAIADRHVERPRRIGIATAPEIVLTEARDRHSARPRRESSPAATCTSQPARTRTSPRTSFRTSPTSVSECARHERPAYSSSASPPLIHQRKGAAAKSSTVATSGSGSHGPSADSVTTATGLRCSSRRPCAPCRSGRPGSSSGRASGSTSCRRARRSPRPSRTHAPRRPCARSGRSDRGRRRR